jgi:hypothetical protein
LRREADIVQTSELVAVPLQWNKSQISESPEAHLLAETKDRNHQAQHWTRRIFTSISNTALRFTRCTGGAGLWSKGDTKMAPAGGCWGSP